MLAALQLGANEQTVSWALGNASVTAGTYVDAKGLAPGAWHYLAVDYDGNKSNSGFCRCVVFYA